MAKITPKKTKNAYANLGELNHSSGATCASPEDKAYYQAPEAVPEPPVVVSPVGYVPPNLGDFRPGIVVPTPAPAPAPTKEATNVLNFRMPLSFVDEFQAYAFHSKRKQNALLRDAFQALKEKEGK